MRGPRATIATRILLLGLATVVTALLAVSYATRAEAAAPGLRLAALAGLRFESPIWVGGSGAPDGAIYVAEQRGVVWKVRSGRRTRFLDIRGVVRSGGEQGLLSMAFAPDFRTSGRMWVYFVLRSGNGQVREYRVRRGRVVAGSGRVTIGVPLSPPDATNHNGGNLWATRGGLLLLSVGDGGGAGDPEGNGQRMGRLMGKLLRINPRAGGGYTIPRSNPFFSRRGARREIYALGLRNPWRFSLDNPTGDLWIGDVGQGQREEVDHMPRGGPAGANFGWNRFEGGVTFDSATRLAAGTRYRAPRIQYSHEGGRCSVTGGLVYRGAVRALRGWYLYADWCDDKVFALRVATGRRIVRDVNVGGIVHFGAGPAGNVYVASQQTGRIYRVAGG